MVNAQFSRAVAHLESREGCPITPGTSLTKVFRLSPCAASNKDRRGIALDGHFQVNQNYIHVLHKLETISGKVLRHDDALELLTSSMDSVVSSG